MTPREIVRQLEDIGIQLRVVEGSLQASPTTLLTNELRQLVRSRKGDLISFLRGAEDDLGNPEWRPFFYCFACGSNRLTDTAEGFRCDDCEELAWVKDEDGVIHRADQHVPGQRAVDFPDPCPTCGGFELWLTLADTWKCQKCEPPTKAIELRERAAELREKYRKRREGGEG